MKPSRFLAEVGILLMLIGGIGARVTEQRVNAALDAQRAGVAAVMRDAITPRQLPLAPTQATVAYNTWSSVPDKPITIGPIYDGPATSVYVPESVHQDLAINRLQLSTGTAATLDWATGTSTTLWIDQANTGIYKNSFAAQFLIGGNPRITISADLKQIEVYDPAVAICLHVPEVGDGPQCRTAAGWAGAVKQ